MKSSVVAIASVLEKPYLDEWIAWYLALGFDRIHIYCNNWPDLPESSDRVVYTKWDGYARQIPAYTHAVANEPADWALFVDVDEFLDLRSRFSDVKEMFSLFDASPGLVFPWVLFGDSGLRFTGDYSVTNRFVMCGKKLNKHVKSAVNLGLLRKNGAIGSVRWLDPHSINTAVMNVHGNRHIGPFHKLDVETNRYMFPVIRHYFTKTIEEYTLRRSIGKVDTPKDSPVFMRDPGDFAAHNLNDVRYETAL